MSISRADLIAQVEKSWGSTTKPAWLDRSKPLISSIVSWSDLETDAKALVLEMLAEFGGCIGTAQRDPDTTWVCEELAKELGRSGASSRRGPLLALAVRAASQLGVDSWAAVVTPFLFSELELQLRLRCSSVLHFSGKVIAPLPSSLPKSARRDVGKRMNNIADVFELALLMRSEPIEEALKRMDFRYRKLNAAVFDADAEFVRLPSGVEGAFKQLPTLRDFLGYTRNAVVHGEANMLVTEAFYLSMLMGPFIIYGAYR